MKEINLTHGKITLVSDEWYEYLSQWNWFVVKRKNNFYAVRSAGSKPNQKQILMHRAITNAPDGLLVDHKDGNGLNNQTDNLRVCTSAENTKNQIKRSTNTSGYKGVHWNKRVEKFQAYIMVGGRQKYLGYFANKIEAAKSYDKAAVELHGEFARLNFPVESEEIANIN